MGTQCRLIFCSPSSQNLNFLTSHIHQKELVVLDVLVSSDAEDASLSVVVADHSHACEIASDVVFDVSTLYQNYEQIRDVFLKAYLIDT